MKLSCGIIRDLLLLYTDDACSEESKKAVGEHLEQCEDCRRHLQAVRMLDNVTQPEPEPEEEKETVRERVIKNSLCKIRRRWMLSVLSVFLLFPLVLLGIMGVHEYQGDGIAFTNLDEIFLARRFMSLIEDGQFAKAAELVDFEYKYEDIQRALKLEPEDFMFSFELCTVDSELWGIKRHLSELYAMGDNYDGEQLWSYLLLNDVQEVLVPEAAWNRVWQTIPEEAEAVGIEEKYFPIDTMWGRFYVGQVHKEILAQEEEITAGQLCRLVSFIPYEIYLAGKEDIERAAWEAYQWNQEYYAFARNMTCEEYVRIMQDKLVRALENCVLNGVAISTTRFKSAYRIGDQWEIMVSAVQKHSSGESFLTGYSFIVRNGKLRMTSSSHSTDDYNDLLAEALRESCP